MTSFKKGHFYSFVPSYMKNGQSVEAQYMGRHPSKVKTELHLFRMRNSGCMITFTDRQLIGDVIREVR